ncbi:MAG: hypothetical protein QM820_62010 [Minicystis sp.]
MYSDGGTMELARAESFAGVCDLLVEALFPDGPPDYDPMVIEEMPVLEGEPLAVRAVLYELSEDMGMERISDPAGLYYLAPVLEERPSLRLVVAWEAAPPRQDAAVGIFRG